MKRTIVALFFMLACLCSSLFASDDSRVTSYYDRNGNPIGRAETRSVQPAGGFVSGFAKGFDNAVDNAYAQRAQMANLQVQQQQIAAQNQQSMVQNYINSGYVICSEEEAQKYETVSIAGPQGNVYMRKKDAGIFNSSEKQETITHRTVTAEYVLDQIVKSYQETMAAYDMTTDGFIKTIAPHTRRFEPSKFHVDMDIYLAKDILKTEKGNLSKIISNDPELNDLKYALEEMIEHMYESSNAMIMALEQRPIPEWDKANAASAMQTRFRDSLDKQWPIKLMERVKRDYPRIEADLPIPIRVAYRCKDKTDSEIAARGKMKALWYISKRLPTIDFVLPNSPAEKAGLKNGDVILGIKDGAIFNDVLDFTDFSYTTKPGQKIKFRVKRGNEEIIKIVTLE